MKKEQPLPIRQTSGKELSDKDIADVNRLLSELSPCSRPVTREDLARVLQSGRIAIVSGSHGIVGMATICVFHTLRGSVGRIEDVVVAESHRGHGLGKRLVDSLLVLAKRNKLLYVELTSALHRSAAGKLYKKMGFTEYPSRYYRIDI